MGERQVLFSVHSMPDLILLLLSPLPSPSHRMAVRVKQVRWTWMNNSWTTWDDPIKREPAEAVVLLHSSALLGVTSFPRYVPSNPICLPFKNNETHLILSSDTRAHGPITALPGDAALNGTSTERGEHQTADREKGSQGCVGAGGVQRTWNRLGVGGSPQVFM